MFDKCTKTLIQIVHEIFNLEFQNIFHSMINAEMNIIKANSHLNMQIVHDERFAKNVGDKT